MFKKIAALIFIAVVSYIVLPLGYGFWDENIGVSGTISFAEATPPSPSQVQSEKAICSTEVSADESDTASSGGELVSGKNLDTAEPETSEQAQTENSGAVSNTDSSAVSSTDSDSEITSVRTIVSGESDTPDTENNQVSNVPEAILPVEASDNPSD